MKIIRIISEWGVKRIARLPKDKRPRPGYKRVEAIVEVDGYVNTRHIDIIKETNEQNNKVDKEIGVPLDIAQL